MFSACPSRHRLDQRRSRALTCPAPQPPAGLRLSEPGKELTAADEASIVALVKKRRAEVKSGAGPSQH